MSAAADVVVVLSAPIPQYQQCLEGFRSAFKGAVEVAQMEDLNESKFKYAVPPRLIFAVGTKALEKAIKVPGNRPLIMFAMILDQEFYKGRVPGVTLNVSLETTIQVIKQLAPKVKKIGVLYTDRSAQFLPKNPVAGVEIVARKVNEVKDVPPAFRRLAPEIDAFVMLADPIVASGEAAKFILSEALKYGVPVVAPSEELVKIGALMSVTADYYQIGVQAADMASKILRGREQDIQQPEKYLIAFNTKTAEALGISIPNQKPFVDPRPKIFN